MTDINELLDNLDQTTRDTLAIIFEGADTPEARLDVCRKVFADAVEKHGPSQVFAQVAGMIGEHIAGYRPEVQAIEARINDGSFTQGDLERIDQLHDLIKRLSGFETEFANGMFAAIKFESIESSDGTTVQ